jgi:hypothetical protein
MKDKDNKTKQIELKHSGKQMKMLEFNRKQKIDNEELKKRRKDKKKRRNNTK